MSAFDLDFARAARRPQPLAWLLLLAGCLAGGSAALAWRDAASARAQAQARVAAHAVTPPPRAPKPDATTLTWQREEAAARRQLALPWADFLQGLQDGRPDDIALLTLDADGRRGDFNLGGLARSESAMLAYYRDLRHAPGLAGVGLTRHEVVDDAGQRRLVFTLRGTWAAP